MYKHTDYKFDVKIIEDIIKKEEAQFKTAVLVGDKYFEKIIKEKSVISADDAFLLYSTYGYPFELITQIAKENNVTVDQVGFEEKRKNHQELSRAGAEQKFKGGLSGTGEMETKYHTTAHLLHQALRDVLGDSVLCKGSNITPERLRFDFNFERKLTEEEKQKEVDKLISAVNAKHRFEKIFFISALTKESVETLCRQIMQQLVFEPEI